MNTIGWCKYEVIRGIYRRPPITTYYLSYLSPLYIRNILFNCLCAVMCKKEDACILRQQNGWEMAQILFNKYY